MKEKYTSKTRQYRHVQIISLFAHGTISSIKLIVAGIIGATSSVFTDRRIVGGIVAWTACTDPTPDSVNPYLQAFRNYSFVSAHPYSGVSDLIPATYIKNAFRTGCTGQTERGFHKFIAYLLKKLSHVSVMILMGYNIMSVRDTGASTSELSLSAI